MTQLVQHITPETSGWRIWGLCWLASKAGEHYDPVWYSTSDCEAVAVVSAWELCHSHGRGHTATVWILIMSSWMLLKVCTHMAWVVPVQRVHDLIPAAQDV